jgi:kynurenine 3-monooxygenase
MNRSLVIGGGLVGSLIAIHLARRGHEVDIFERHPDFRIEADTKRPALNLTLCERGLRALGEVGLRERVEALAAPAHGRSIHGEDGFTAYQPYGAHGEAIHSIARSELNETLINLAEGLPGIAFHFGQKCTHLDLATPSARFEDVRTGAITEIKPDRIFGADGAYSTVRLHLQKLERFNYSQQYLSQGYKSLKIPARADGMPVLESGSLHVWPRGQRMLIGFPNRNASVSLSLLLPFDGAHSFASLTTADELRSFFHAWFPDVAELIPGLAEQFFARPPNSLLTVRCAPWSYEDKVLLVGDAAHAILPSYGQGANAGFDDCSVFVQCMDEYGDDWRSVFRAFEARRRPSMDYMADLCVEHFVELCELVADPNFLKRKELERRLNDLYPDLYQSLYTMVTFTTTPYIEAMRIEHRQRKFMDRLIADEGYDLDVESPRIKELLLRLSHEEIA